MSPRNNVEDPESKNRMLETEETDEKVVAKSETATSPSQKVSTDPWAQVVVSSTASESKTNTRETTAASTTMGERWEMLRNRLQPHRLDANKTHLEDEQATAVIRRSPPPEGAKPAPWSRFIPKRNNAAAGAESRYQLSSEQLASLRACNISMTLQKPSQDAKWGFGLEQNGERVRIGIMAGIGLLEHAPFQKGDRLVSVNNQKCTNAENTIQDLVKMEGKKILTLMIETPKGNPNLVQAMVRKPSADANLGIGFYIPADAPPIVSEDQEPTEGKEKEPDIAFDESGKNPSKSPAKTKLEDDPTSKLLKINQIDANGLFAHSSLSQGDIVVAINATPCAEMKPEEAEALLKQSDDNVTITAMKADQTSLAQRWMRHAKRAGVAIGGGTMVGIGLVFIPTLPPPFGEILIVGGVSVLGTEFEGPKRVMRSARDSLERAVGREEEKKDDGKSAEEGDATVASSEAASNSTRDGDANDNTKQEVPKKSMGDRFKNFGRRHVLPFLDQVVGDRKEEEKKGNDEPGPSMDDSKADDNSYDSKGDEKEGNREPNPSTEESHIDTTKDDTSPTAEEYSKPHKV